MATLPTMISCTESSNIGLIGYKPEKKKLYVKFKEGGYYSYSPVTKKQWKEFCESESKGSWFWKNIRSDKNITNKKLSNQ